MSDDDNGPDNGPDNGTDRGGNVHRPQGPGQLPPERPVSRDRSASSRRREQGAAPAGREKPEEPARDERKQRAGETGEPGEPDRPDGSAEPNGPEESGSSGATATATATDEGRTGRQRLAQAVWPPRVTRAQLIVALLLFVLGLGLAIQVRTTSENSSLRGARQEDLVRILDELDGRSKRLEDEKQSLQSQRTELENSSDQAKEARKQTQQKERQLGVLAGTVGAQGPGIKLTVTDSHGSIESDMLLDTVQELRAAGAEAIQVNGVRVVASTYFSDSGGGVRVDGRKISQPYRFDVIGKPQDLEPALNIPGGVVQTLRKEQAGVSVSSADKVIVDALRSAKRPDYARSSSQ